MRDYQRRKNNKYYLPKEVYHQTLWFIRDYPRMAERLNEILLEGSSGDGIPGGNRTGDATLNKVLKRDELFRKTRAIEDAIERIPEEYRKGVWESLLYSKAFPLDADRSTYARYKSRAIYDVAIGMKFIRKEEI